ncbi:MAG: FAD-dependent oxidoreductase [Spirochaetia bacterium]|nr:FAD-dependent oxidoreductase [Spirochaetia bacterium]
MYKRFDTIIIGAGIIGTSIARELSRYNGSILLLEKGRDVAVGATRANSGIVHGGYAAKWGTRKGELAAIGNRMYQQLSEELGFPYTRIGSYVLAFNDDEEMILNQLYENGLKNGVISLDICTKKEILVKEPLLNPLTTAGLYCGETGIVSPYEAAIAFAENSVQNGVVLKLNHEVLRIEKASESYRVFAGNQIFTGSVVINAAGLYTDRISEMVGLTDFRIRPRKGEYLLLKRGAAKGLNSVIFQTPTQKGKGILVSPTTWGNLLIGPNAEDTTDRADSENNYSALKSILEQAKLSMPSLTLSSLIRFFTGVRPASDKDDFIIEESALSGFIQAAGIESPGLTSAPAIAERVRNIMLAKGYVERKKNSFQKSRNPITKPGPLKPFLAVKDLVELPPGNPDRLVCRCEQVTEAIITDALNRGILIDSLDAVKRRTRAGMGACQGKFCGPRVKELIRWKNSLKDDEIEEPSAKNQELLKELRKL